MSPESNRETELRIAAYSSADAILDRHPFSTRTITQEALRLLLVLAYLDGYGTAGHKVLDEAEVILTKALR